MAPLIFIALWWMVWLPLLRINRPYWFLWYSVLGCLLIWSAWYTWKAYDYRIHPQKQVVHNGLLYIGPDAQYLSCGNVCTGDLVKLVQLHGSWCQVKKDELSGWMPMSHLH